MHEHLVAAARDEFLRDGDGRGLGHQADLLRDDRDADRRRQGEVRVGDVMGIIERVRDLRRVRVDPAVAKRNQLAVERRADRRAGQPGDERGLFGVVEIEHVRETHAPQRRDESEPARGATGKGIGGVDIGIERQHARVGGLREHRDPRLGPVFAQIPEHAAE
jgi:hypothetical protein